MRQKSSVLSHPFKICSADYPTTSAVFRVILNSNICHLGHLCFCLLQEEKRRLGERTPWTDEQRQVVRSAFAKYIRGEGLSGKLDCCKLIKDNIVLANHMAEH